ncbi:MAG TPA: SAM-dependent methyltransferase, partial [Reyranella sp.]|nr:SAM-dependent methyltransferase [Reyranella sp.]
MKKILIIGIGAGDPDFVTMQAVKALNTVDVFFILEKGAAKDGMMELRREIC